MWYEMKRSAVPPTRRLELQEILQHALDLDAEFETWESDLPSAWKYGVEPNTPEARSKYSNKWQRLVLMDRGAPADIHTYPTLKRCFIWGYYRTSRMFLLRDLLEMLNWMSRLPETEPRTSLTRTWKSLECRSSDTKQDADETMLTALDDTALRVQRLSITRRLIKVIEETCSSILGTFTVPAYKKSLEDVMGFRGYSIAWPLGTMDAILSSGLVPDSNTSSSPSAASWSPSTGSLSGNSGQSTSSAGEALNTFYHDTVMDTAVYGFGFLPLIPPSPASSNFTQAQAGASQLLGMADKRQHPFDSMPRHLNDMPIDHMEIPAADTIDVVAKREWVNSMLYYIGTELGVKKALAVPVVEGYMPIVKARVDGVLQL
jgi:hypothetical protein